MPMFRALPELKKELWGSKLWTGGFYVSTVGLCFDRWAMFRPLGYVSTVGQRGGYAALSRYIENQGKKPEAENLRLLFSTTDDDAEQT